ncbi:MAG: DsrE family protein [Chitinophagales bacterium]
MKPFFPSFLFIYFMIGAAFAQKSGSSDSLAKAIKDSLRWEALKATAIFPVINAGEWSGVIPVQNIQARPDATLKFKLLINLTLWDADTASIRKISGGIAEIGRLINLHVAAGIPKENLDIVVVVHRRALFAFLTDAAYEGKYKSKNPNLEIIKKMNAMDVKFLGCGQAEQFLAIQEADLVPEIKTALTAQVMLSNYQMKGYSMFKIESDK